MAGKCRSEGTSGRCRAPRGRPRRCRRNGLGAAPATQPGDADAVTAALVDASPYPPLARLGRWDGTTLQPVTAGSVSADHVVVVTHGWAPGLRPTYERLQAATPDLVTIWNPALVEADGAPALGNFGPLLGALQTADPAATVLMFSWVDQSATTSDPLSARDAEDATEINGHRLAVAVDEVARARLVGPAPPHRPQLRRQRGDHRRRCRRLATAPAHAHGFARGGTGPLRRGQERPAVQASPAGRRAPRLADVRGQLHLARRRTVQRPAGPRPGGGRAPRRRRAATAARRSTSTRRSGTARRSRPR